MFGIIIILIDICLGSDCLHAGIATHACNDIQAVKDDLLQANNKEDIENVLEKHSESFEESDFSLEDKLPLIDECFKEDHVEGILYNLGQVKDDAWSQKTSELMLKMSPTSMKVTLQMLREGKHLDLKECLQMEYRLVRRCCEDSDFYEGVRALLIDKDNKPNWNPAKLPEVNETQLQRYFSRLPNNEELQL